MFESAAFMWRKETQRNRMQDTYSAIREMWPMRKRFHLFFIQCAHVYLCATCICNGGRQTTPFISKKRRKNEKIFMKNNLNWCQIYDTRIHPAHTELQFILVMENASSRNKWKNVHFFIFEIVHETHQNKETAKMAVLYTERSAHSTNHHHRHHHHHHRRSVNHIISN